MILVLNAGSSSLKVALLDESAGSESALQVIEGTDYEAMVKQALATVPRTSDISVVGHRVVHGGTRFRSAVRVDTSVKKALQELVELAPLHNPPALSVIEAAQKALPAIPHVAVFDTAFFAGLPPSQYIYPVPYEWHSRWGIRRFGFHGISYAYCAQQAAEIMGRSSNELNLIVCHLGNGCSASAIRGGDAVATTMGFTPLEGLMMGSRSGSIDPGILFYLQRQKGLTAEQLENSLNYESGLLGVSGLSSDFREVCGQAEAGNERARLALEIYADRIRSAIGALAVTLGRVDALVFTAGVGENACQLRAEVCKGLECLGLKLDPEKNAASRPDSEIAAADSKVRVLLIHTHEEKVIAREAQRVASQKRQIEA